MQLKFLQSKKVIIGLVLLVLVMGGLYFNTNQILADMKDRIVARLESTLGTNIQLEALRLSGFAKISAYDIVIKSNEGGNLIQAEELVVNCSVLDLLTNYSQPLKVIKDIELNAPQINLIKRDKWNYNFLLSSTSQQQDENKELFPIYVNNGTTQIKTNQFEEQISQINGIIDLSKETGIFLDGQVKGLNSLIKSNIIINGQDYQGEIKFSNLQLTNLTNKSNLNLPENLKMAGALNAKIKFKGAFNQQHSFYGDLDVDNGSINYQGFELEKINGDIGINDYGLKVKNVRGYYSNNLVDLSGSVFGWQNPQLNLDYKIKNLDLTTIEQFLDQEINLSGQADIQGQLEGTVSEPTIRSKLKVDRLDLAQETIKNIGAELYYKDGVLNLEKLNADYNQGAVSLDGTLNFNDDFNYIVNTDFKNLSVSEIEFDFLSKLDLKGIVAGQAIISGIGLNKKDLNVLGSLEIDSGAVRGYDFQQFSSRFWLNKQKLFLNNTKLENGSSTGTMNGVVSLAGDVDLDLKLKDISLAELKPFHNLERLKGQVDIDGALKGNLSEPQLEAEVKGDSIYYQDIKIGVVNGAVDFAQQELTFVDVTIPKYASKLAGEINFKQQNSNIVVTTNDLAASKIDSLIHDQLQLTGQLSAQTEINSLLSNPQVESNLKITNGLLLEKQKFDNLILDLSYVGQTKKLNVKQGQINYKDSSLEIAGTMIEQALDFNFNSSQVVWEDINFTDNLKDLTGSAEVSGSVYGNSTNPKVAAKFNAQEVKFAEKAIGNLNGRLDYKNHNIYLTDIDVKANSNQYRLNGSLNLNQNKIDKISVGITSGTVNYLNQFIPSDLDIDYQFNGQIEAKGKFKEPQFNVELVVQDNDGAGTLELTGDYWWAQNANLKVVATKFGIDVLNNFDLFPYDVAGDLNLNGKLTGSLTAPDFKSDLKVTKGAVANLNYEKLVGSLDMIAGKKVILNQELQGEGENVVQATGQIPLQAPAEFDLNVSLAEGNLRILSLLIPKIKSANGKGSADLKVTGSLAKPKLSGAAEVVAGSFSYPTLDRKISNLNGQLEFINNKLLLQNITGYYGQGSFAGGGNITLDGLRPADYDLQLSGKKIAFEHGSWQGLNNLDVSITGTGFKPQITGEIKAYNTQFELPVKWPQAKGGGIKKMQPQLDLTVNPGSNVRVVNEKIDILVQSGNLNLRTIDGKVRLIGELSSNSGRFTYYNTEFELQEGRAVFRQYDYIPNLQLEATTEIYDRVIAEDETNLGDPYHNITLSLTGPADQLNYQLSSDSNLGQEKIISLLTGQGGIGNLLEKNYEQALTAELRRVIGEGIKTEVIYKVERSFEKSLDLDQVRIKSLLENNDSIEVELGKYIFNNFMLKYNHSFLEESKAIGFEYYFNQGLDNLMIQGNYNSSGEYEVGLEASIPFE